MDARRLLLTLGGVPPKVTVVTVTLFISSRVNGLQERWEDAPGGGGVEYEGGVEGGVYGSLLLAFDIVHVFQVQFGFITRAAALWVPRCHAA